MRLSSRAPRATFAFAIAVAIGMAAAAPAGAQPVTTTSSGLGIIDTEEVGTGPSPKPSQTVVVHYTGWLYAEGGQRSRPRNSIARLTAASRSNSRSAKARS